MVGSEGVSIGHRGSQEQGRQGLGCVLVRRDRQPARGHRADTYLFLRRLDELQTLAEAKATRTNKPLTGAPFPAGNDPQGLSYSDLRWSRFNDFDPAKMYQVVGERAFPFLRYIGADGFTFAHNMRDARLTIPTPGLLTKVVVY